jgi:hypothetical protein
MAATPEQVGQAVGAGMRAAARALQSSAYDAAREATSGPLSRAMQRHYGPFYARRLGSPRLNPDVTNVQTGALRRGWRKVALRRDGSDYTAAVDNTDAKAAMLEAGTKRMFARRPHELAEAQMAREAERLVFEAVHRELLRLG